MILVIAATEHELSARGDGLVCGIGPERAGRETARALAELRPSAVLHVGIAGARRDGGVPLLQAVIGTASVDCDGGRDALAPDPRLLAAARHTLPEAANLPIGTAAAVGGTSGVPVEAMEGHAVLTACAAAGVPAIEVRVVANEIEEPDRARWRFADGFAETVRITDLLVPALDQAIA